MFQLFLLVYRLSLSISLVEKLLLCVGVKVVLVDTRGALVGCGDHLTLTFRRAFASRGRIHSEFENVRNAWVAVARPNERPRPPLQLTRTAIYVARVHKYGENSASLTVVLR